jgi:hypothetical protein
MIHPQPDEADGAGLQRESAGITRVLRGVHRQFPQPDNRLLKQRYCYV